MADIKKFRWLVQAGQADIVKRLQAIVQADADQRTKALTKASKSASAAAASSSPGGKVASAEKAKKKGMAAAMSVFND